MVALCATLTWLLLHSSQTPSASAADHPTIQSPTLLLSQQQRLSVSRLNRRNFAYFPSGTQSIGDRGSKKAYTGPRTGMYLPTKFGCDRSIMVGCRLRNDRQTSRQTEWNDNKAHSLRTWRNKCVIFHDNHHNYQVHSNLSFLSDRTLATFPSCNHSLTGINVYRNMCEWLVYVHCIIANSQWLN